MPMKNKRHGNCSFAMHLADNESAGTTYWMQLRSRRASQTRCDSSPHDEFSAAHPLREIIPHIVFPNHHAMNILEMSSNETASSQRDFQTEFRYVNTGAKR